jgi:hypothetical protein
MAGGVVGALRVVLGMNAAEFTKGAKDAEAAMDQLGRKVQAFGTGLAKIGAVTSSAAGAVVAFGKISLDAWQGQEKATAAVEAALKSMGGAAGSYAGKLVTGLGKGGGVSVTVRADHASIEGSIRHGRQYRHRLAPAGRHHRSADRGAA